MSDITARLLAQIAASPHDMQLRQVYADHLLERGDPRGELVALQLAGIDPGRVAHLIATYRHLWVGPLVPWIKVPASRFKGGFLVEVKLADLKRDLAPVIGDPVWATVRTLHLGPVRRLRGGIGRFMRSVSVLVAHPVMRSLATVTVDGDPLMLERDRDGLARFVPRFR